MTAAPPLAGFPVPGRDDLTCPLSRAVIKAVKRHAREHPWPGNRPLDCPAHFLATTAITEPGRPIRLLYSYDVGYHASGWFANADWEENLHLSFSHPRPDRRRVYGNRVGIGSETVSDDEVRAWGLVFWGPQHAPKAWFEPAASLFDPHRLPNVVHLRLFLDRSGRPFIPKGEPYHIRPWADGSSPAKITEGRLGADVR